MQASQLINTDFKLGILGGGQLGKMLSLAAGNWHLPIHILDQKSNFPSGPYAFHFTEGSFKNYDDVYNFGKTVDVLTIEIEHVNTEALIQLEKEGVIVHPSPSKLEIIKDKGLQKSFYKERNLPTAEFELYEDENAIKKAIDTGKLTYPFVQKSRTAGYDGKGVAVIQSEADMHKLLPSASVIEPLVDIDKELAVIAARNPSGETSTFPTVEMEFNPDANLVEFLVCPADINNSIEKQAQELALSVINAFDICGLLAVELFLTKSGALLINEVAPRPHNSGHHTIDSCYTSQFEQHLRGVLDLPLGSTKMKSPSVMVNLLGAPDHKGKAKYDGLDEALKIEGAKLHLYGKTQTKPYRKMGHATVLAADVETARSKAKQLQNTLQIVSQ